MLDVLGKAVARIGSTNLAHWPHVQERTALELGLEGFVSAPSRPVPKFRADAAKLSLPSEGEVNGLRRRISTASSGAGSRGARKLGPKRNAIQEDFGTNQILPEGSPNHKAILRLRLDHISRGINSLRIFIRWPLPLC